MLKKFRVISQATPLAGKTQQEVHRALLKLNLTSEQVQLLLQKPLVIKKALTEPEAQGYAERFATAGLKVRIEAYEIAAPPTPNTESKQRDQLYETLLKAFTKPVQPVDTLEPAGRTSPLSLLSALPAPLIYGGLLVVWSFILIGYLGGGYALLFGGLSLPPAIDTLLWLIAWLLPALLGGGLLIGLLYPFWPRRIPAPHLRLDPKRHIRFHHLINQMTAAMDVPAPQFIEITAGSQVRVAPARGIRSLNRGDLRLTLGLAALASCNLDQLMGLIAREFGRFSSSKATRTTTWIHTINGWLAHHARIPAEWDERFEAWAEAYPATPLRWSIGRAQRLTLWVRRLLGRLTALNARTTERTLLQLERNADLYQARVCGTQAFATIAAKQAALMVAEQEIHQLNHLALYGRDQLLLDLPAAIRDSLPASTRLNTHPVAAPLWEPHIPDSARIERVSALTGAAFISCPQPAHLLFDDFAQLCDNVTLHTYHRQGIADAEQLRVDNAKILREREAILRQARIDTIQKGARAPVNPDGSVDWTAGKR